MIELALDLLFVVLLFAVGLVPPLHRQLMRVRRGDLVVSGLGHIGDGLLIILVMLFLGLHCGRDALGFGARCQSLQDILLHLRNLLRRTRRRRIVWVHMPHHWIFVRLRLVFLF